MSRFARGQVLPVPPIVSQLHALEPGGIIDPASTTDCGEACCSSVLSVASSFLIEPGCIREAMGLSRESGSTTPADVARFLGATCGKTGTLNVNTGIAWAHLGMLRHHGHYALILGTWLSPDALHWRLAFERSSATVSAMDPWTASYVSMTKEEFNASWEFALVACDLWAPV